MTLLLGFRGTMTKIPALVSKNFTMKRGTVTMRDRSKNRKPLQRGRNLSIEAIQAIQALKRVSKALIVHEGGGGGGGRESLETVFRSKIRRLIKFDMMAVLEELQKQNEPYLALKVFGEIREEHWYIPQFSVYSDMIRVLASCKLLKEVEQVLVNLQSEKKTFKSDIIGFNHLLMTLIEFGFLESAMDCFRRMQAWGLEPDKSTFSMLIKHLEAKGKVGFSSAVKKEAMECYGALEFLEFGILDAENICDNCDFGPGDA